MDQPLPQIWKSDKPTCCSVIQARRDTTPSDVTLQAVLRREQQRNLIRQEPWLCKLLGRFRPLLYVGPIVPKERLGRSYLVSRYYFLESNARPASDHRFLQARNRTADRTQTRSGGFDRPVDRPQQMVLCQTTLLVVVS